MWALDNKEGWAPKNWCFWTVVLEKTLESLLDCKEIKPVNPKGNQSWIFIGSWSSDTLKSWLNWKDPDAGKDWGQEKGTTEDEMVGWHHRLNGYEFGATPRKSETLACCHSWSRKEFDMTWQLNNNNLCTVWNSKTSAMLYVSSSMNHF